MARIYGAGYSLGYPRLISFTSRPFVVTELGVDVDPFLLHLYVALAEKKRALISRRTRDALAAKKAQGKQLGNPKLLAAAAERADRAGVEGACGLKLTGDCRRAGPPRHQELERQALECTVGQGRAGSSRAGVVMRFWAHKGTC